MTSLSIENRRGIAVRAWYGPRRRILILGAVGLLFITAFLLCGPVGLGNGPLSVSAGGTEGWADARDAPVGFVIPVQNSGDGPAVIDGVDLIGGTTYSSPRVLGLEVLTSGKCGGAWPAHQASKGFTLAGCGGTSAGPLAGHAFGPTHPVFFGYPAAAEVTAPPAGTCWVLTKIVVHYHVGIRHYSATDPFQLAVCVHPGQIDSAMKAAQAAG
jgi:hypothetical protein